MRDLRRSLSRLPLDQREVIRLVAINGLDYEQAARQLDIPEGTVGSRLSRGRAVLREMMEGTA